MIALFIFFERYYDQLGAMQNKLPISEGQVSTHHLVPFMAVKLEGDRISAYTCEHTVVV